MSVTRPSLATKNAEHFRCSARGGTLPVMKNTDSKIKSSSKEDLFKQWIQKKLVLGAKFILITVATGLGPVVWGIYTDITELRSKEKLQDQKIEQVEKKNAKMGKQINDLHWHLIKSKNVKVPANK